MAELEHHFRPALPENRRSLPSLAFTPYAAAEGCFSQSVRCVQGTHLYSDGKCWNLKKERNIIPF